MPAYRIVTSVSASLVSADSFDFSFCHIRFLRVSRLRVLLQIKQICVGFCVFLAFLLVSDGFCLFLLLLPVSGGAYPITPLLEGEG